MVILKKKAIMYIIRFKKGNVYSIMAADARTLLTVACILEREQLKFKITNEAGLIDQQDMCWGSFNYWLHPDQGF